VNVNENVSAFWHVSGARM